MMLSTMLLVGALATTAAGDTLYATTFGRNSNLVVVDYETGVTTVIGSTGYQVNGLTHDPVTGNLYATVSTNSPSNPECLVTLDKVTGAGTLVGCPNIGVILNPTAASDGTLYAWTEDGDDLVILNKADGSGQVISVSNVGSYSHTFAVDNNGVLHIYMPSEHYIIDGVTGVATLQPNWPATFAHHGSFRSKTNDVWAIVGEPCCTGDGPSLIVALTAAGKARDALVADRRLFTLAWSRTMDRGTSMGMSMGMSMGKGMSTGNRG